MLLEEVLKLNEVSVSRVLENIQNDKKTFAFVSAYQGTKKENENIKATKELKADIKKLKLGYKLMPSGWRESLDLSLEFEKGIMIMMISKSEALRLGKKYKQYSIIYKDANTFSEIKVSTGKTIRNFYKDLATSDKKVENAFSQTRNKKFSFREKRKRKDVRRIVLRQRKNK